MKTENDDSKDKLQEKFLELSDKYQNALHNDLRFEQVKHIYSQLQEIKRKLIELNEKIEN